MQKSDVCPTLTLWYMGFNALKALMLHTLCTHSAAAIKESLQLCKFPFFKKFPICYVLVNLGISNVSEWLRSLWTLVLSFGLFPDELPLAWSCSCLSLWVIPTFPLCPHNLSVLCWYFYFFYLDPPWFPFLNLIQFPLSLFHLILGQLLLCLLQGLTTRCDRIYTVVFFLYLTQLGLC